MDLANVIQKAMIDKKIKSATELSKVSGVPYMTVKFVLDGKNSSLATVEKILSSLGLMLIVAGDQK